MDSTTLPQLNGRPSIVSKFAGAASRRMPYFFEMLAASPPAHSGRIFRGWWIVLVAVLGQCFSLGTMLGYTFGIFAKPLTAVFHTDRASIALAVSIMELLSVVGAPGAGRLVDRYGARGVIVTSFALLASCLAALSFVGPPLWHFYALYALAGFLGAATIPVTYGRVVANWFDRKRGLALGIASTGVGLGAFLMPSFVQFLIDERGWRVAYQGLAAVTVLIAIPVVGFFLRSNPKEFGLTPDGEERPFTPKLADPPPGMTLSEAIRTWTFWQLCVLFFAVAACVNGAIGHLAPMLTDRGLSGRSAAFATSLFGAASIAGRMGNGFMVDRFFAPRVILFPFAGAAAGVALLWGGATGNHAYLAAALLGLAIGAESDVMPFLVSRYFGMRSMGELLGCIFGAYTVGNAVGRYLFGVGFDATKSYDIPLACAFIVLCLSILGTFTLKRYRSPAVD